MKRIPVTWGKNGPEIGVVRSYDPETGKIVAEIDNKEYSELMYRLLTEEDLISVSCNCEAAKLKRE